VIGQNPLAKNMEIKVRKLTGIDVQSSKECQSTGQV